MARSQGAGDVYHAARLGFRTLWETFSAQRNGERSINVLARQVFGLERIGIELKNSAPSLFSYLMAALPLWGRLEELVSKNPVFPGVDLDLGEVWRKFYDFNALLSAVAPWFTANPSCAWPRSLSERYRPGCSSQP